jgi:hypothetical protein
MRVNVKTQEHIEVRTSLQVARNGCNVCEAIKDTRRSSRTIVKDDDTDRMDPLNIGI